ncbi:manganese-dependent ADP-ribose/CDP-alcohol diphosphatase isoform X1 [Synchiropus splendidus]|uniref:manganese-dependent ADP-ribose/CDP-alcohol diphosphatase isoform X1 n=2 Tax=Synchiropus splendidus TaxID=270530 RepID=UPI00237E77B5|nr:manganese-dependent ADP-ribose/CDP-alcohol diphosphatase isoform X1 [Synchiropus splendidus]
MHLFVGSATIRLNTEEPPCQIAVCPEIRTEMGGLPPETPIFSFGVIADIQYADVDERYNYSRTAMRYYRNSVHLLRNARQSWCESAVKPEFIIQLGDIIDGVNHSHRTSEQALERVMAEFSRCPIPVHHVWGNHEFYNFSRRELFLSKINSSGSGVPLPGGDIYAYTFSPFPGFTFVVLDGYDVSLLGREDGSVKYRDAHQLITQFNDSEDLNSPPGRSEDLEQRFSMFNGALSKEQLDWLDSVLSSADEKQEKVTIVCHLPVHPRSTTNMCLLWNYDEVLGMIKAHRSVVCFISGHDHDGGYYSDKDTGVHHLTLEGVIETPPHSDAFGTISVYSDRMELKGFGRIPDRVCLFR